MPIFLFAENKLIKCGYTKGREKPRKLIVDHESTTKGLAYHVKQFKKSIRRVDFFVSEWYKLNLEILTWNLKKKYCMLEQN